MDFCFVLISWLIACAQTFPTACSAFLLLVSMILNARSILLSFIAAMTRTFHDGLQCILEFGVRIGEKLWLKDLYRLSGEWILIVCNEW